MCFQMILCVRVICARSAFVMDTITSPRNALDGTGDSGFDGIAILGLKGICAATLEIIKNKTRNRSNI